MPRDEVTYSGAVPANADGQSGDLVGRGWLTERRAPNDRFES